MKDLTAGEVARVCQVSIHSVHNWIANGLLPYYLLPGSTHRRVRHADLRGFVRANNLPAECLDRLEALEGERT